MEDFEKKLLEEVLEKKSNELEYISWLLSVFGAAFIPVIIGKYLNWPDVVGTTLFIVIITLQIYFVAQNSYKENILKRGVRVLLREVRELENKVSITECDNK